MSFAVHCRSCLRRVHITARSACTATMTSTITACSSTSVSLATTTACSWCSASTCSSRCCNSPSSPVSTCRISIRLWHHYSTSSGGHSATARGLARCSYSTCCQLAGVYRWFASNSVSSHMAILPPTNQTVERPTWPAPRNWGTLWTLYVADQLWRVVSSCIHRTG